MSTSSNPITSEGAKRLQRLVATYEAFLEALDALEKADFPDPNVLSNFGTDVTMVGFDVTARAEAWGATVPDDDDEDDELEREAS